MEPGQVGKKEYSLPPPNRRPSFYKKGRGKKKKLRRLQNRKRNGALASRVPNNLSPGGYIGTMTEIVADNEGEGGTPCVWVGGLVGRLKRHQQTWVRPLDAKGKGENGNRGT